MSKTLRQILTAGACVALVATAACGRPSGQGGANAAAGFVSPAAVVQQTRWSTFADPAEHAFTIDVPEGWTVTGGSRRMSAVEIRTGVTARSPDGAIEIFVGDLDIPFFALPNPMFESIGLREGMTYSPGYGQNLVIARYLSGDAFAGDWGARRIAASCAQPSSLGVRALPQASTAMDATYARYGIQSSVQAGEAEYSCTYAGGPGAGYVFAATERVETGGNGIWGIKALAGFAARADRKAEAAALLEHMVGSFRIDPDWAARQQGVNANVSHIVSETNDAVTASISERFANQQAGQDRAMDRATQGRRGTATFNDPVEGRRELDNAEHQWRLRNGAVVSTNSSTPPEPDATELQRVQ